jgi:hypothetical protein
MALGLIPPVLLGLLGMALVIASSAGGGGSWAVASWLGWALVAVGTLMVVAIVYWMRLPRLGYENGQFLVYLRTVAPLRVPIDVVECFFLGQGPSRIAGPEGKEAETTTIVVRLAESASEWRHVDVRPELGHWCDGYITIRGTWCEPINRELMERLNRRLIEVHRQRRQQRELETA